MIGKVLIANRGEIAVRILRALMELDIRGLAVYSEADREALHVRLADEAYCIGPPAPEESYLAIEKIIGLAKEKGAQAIHPGYGFLAENYRFAQRCQEESLIFLGPPPEAIRVMGSKTEARRVMREAGVPVVPGTVNPVESEAEVSALAGEIGYPIVLKASAGGGGKGMRIIRSREEVPSSFRATRSEAQSAFGDPAVYVEKYLENPRHVEVQILGDQQGHLIHLGERECTIQRRHQKVIEESPSVIMTEELRRAMGETALAAARAVGYYSAGTVEFLVDRRGNFYFLEMNTRLQVEHPVTEMVTGLDLVKEMIRIAAGEKLPYRQEEIQFRGAAIECRIYAEDPANNFFPCPGRVEVLRSPEGPGVRVDSGVFPGYEIPIYYDPLIAKLIVWGRDRQEAIRRMERALREYTITGVKTVIPFLLEVMRDEHFHRGEIDTSYIDRKLLQADRTKEKGRMTPAPEEEGTEKADIVVLAAALDAFLTGKEKKPAMAPLSNGTLSSFNPWKMAGRRKLLESRG
ncbi:MAG: acetyl-CoA carboxylase biotin carboxylase subunit [Nitrospinae bacterium]|nr:acetyl-CoA carboxylase biotin carboxylase subunit [Nitrospinota bacterium]